VRGALLVAPPDTEREDMPPQLHGWRPVVRRRLPLRATLVYSQDDPYAAPDFARALALDWGARAVTAGSAGHVNADSGLGDWLQGQMELAALCG
jgi:predicted alpha/beta hydrolase family esterase